MEIIFVGKTDQGLSRPHNEDYFAISQDITSGTWKPTIEEPVVLNDSPAVFIVADGMGGEEAGEVASQLAVDTIKSRIAIKAGYGLEGTALAESLRSEFQNAHRSILADAKQNPSRQGMGTTLSLLYLHKGKATAVWSGDSRIYRFLPAREGGEPVLKMVTRDHSFVWQMVEKGMLSPEEARTHPQSNIITQCLGDPNNPPKPESATFDPIAGEKILLCSDGLNSMLSDREIATIMDAGLPVGELADHLIAAANGKGGADNITVVICEISRSDNVPARSYNATTLNQNDLGKLTAATGMPAGIDQKNWLKIGLMLLMVVVTSLLYWRYSQERNSMVEVEGTPESNSINEGAHVGNIEKTITKKPHANEVEIPNAPRPAKKNTVQKPEQKKARPSTADGNNESELWINLKKEYDKLLYEKNQQKEEIKKYYRCEGGSPNCKDGFDELAAKSEGFIVDIYDSFQSIYKDGKFIPNDVSAVEDQFRYIRNNININANLLIGKREGISEIQRDTPITDALPVDTLH